MLGIDVVEIARFRDNYEGWVRRVLSERERQELTSRKDQGTLEYLAGRFAAKEAYVKASGQRTIGWDEVEILDDFEGKPHLYVMGRESGEVSIAHDGYAVAVVLLQ